MSSKGDSISSIQASDIGGKGGKDSASDSKGTDSNTMVKWGLGIIVVLGILWWVYNNYIKKPSREDLMEQRRRMMMEQQMMRGGMNSRMDPRMLQDPRMMNDSRTMADPRMDPRLMGGSDDDYDPEQEDMQRVGRQNMPPDMMYGNPRANQRGDPRMMDPRMMDPRMMDPRMMDPRMGQGMRRGKGKGGRQRPAEYDDEIGSIPPGQ